MDIHAKVVTESRSTVTISDPADIDALRMIAALAAPVLAQGLREAMATPHDARRAYALAQWIRDRVPPSSGV